MTAIAMKYVVNPVEGFFYKLGDWIVKTGKLQEHHVPQAN